MERELLPSVDRELDDGDVGLRKRVYEHRPRAVIETPAVVVQLDGGGLCDLRDLLREVRVAQRRYSTSKSSCGKPKKSWIVRGCGIAVTAVRPVYQCAETTRIPRGLGTL